MIRIGVLYNSIATLYVVAAGSRAQFVAINRAIAVNRMGPVIECVFPFAALPLTVHWRKTYSFCATQLPRATKSPNLKKGFAPP